MDEKEILLEVYKNHSSHSGSITTIRNTLNAVFISINALCLPVCFDKYPLLGCMGFVLCFVWKRQLDSLRILNCVKIQILSELEQKIGFDFYDREWKLLENKGYKTITNNDKLVIYVFMTAYLMILTPKVLFILYHICQSYHFLSHIFYMFQGICLA